MITFKEINKTELNMQMDAIFKQLKKIKGIEFVKTSLNFQLEIRYKGFLLGFVEYNEDVMQDMKLFFTIKETAFSEFARFKISASSLCFYSENEELKLICKMLNQYIYYSKMQLVIG